MIVLGILSVLLVFSQFGKRLSAKNSVSWWSAFGFLILMAIDPYIISPLSEWFGFQLISNFIFSICIAFLLLQLLRSSADHTQLQRKVRQIVSETAARDFRKPFFAALSDRATLEIAKPESDKSVLVVVPCYNEEDCLPATIELLNELIQTESQIDFCIINDGSTDTSRRILNKKCPLNHVNHSTNIGVAGVLLTGFKIAKEHGFKWVVQCDCDGQHPILQIHQLVQRAQTERDDLLIGSRFAEIDLLDTRVDRNAIGLQSTTLLRRIGALCIIATLRIFGKKAVSTDPTSGFRVYGENAIEVLIQDMPDEYPEPESLAILGLSGCKISERFVRMNARQGGESSLSGLKSLQFMLKVTSALIGLRLRSLSKGFP